MDNSNISKIRNNEHLGVNKMGKNIRKSPLHQPNFGNPNKQEPPQPHVYNISKNDFRNIVQQLTGSPSRNQPAPRPPQNPPKPQSMRLQKIRPPPLAQITRSPAIPLPAPVPPFNNSFIRPDLIGQQPSISPFPAPFTHGDPIRPSVAESPISAYMRYLQSSMINPSPRQTQAHTHTQPQSTPPMSGLLPIPPMPAPFPSPRGNGSALLPSPTSQYVFPSPSAFLNLMSPRSPYPLLSPGFQYPPLTPNFFSSLSQAGILGPGPQAPHSPGIYFPSSPSGFFPISSPKWRDQ